MGYPLFVIFRKPEHTFPVGMQEYYEIWESLAFSPPEKLLSQPAGAELLRLRNYAISILNKVMQASSSGEFPGFFGGTLGVRGIKECLGHFFHFWHLITVAKRRNVPFFSVESLLSANSREEALDTLKISGACTNRSIGSEEICGIFVDNLMEMQKKPVMMHARPHFLHEPRNQRPNALKKATFSTESLYLDREQQFMKQTKCAPFLGFVISWCIINIKDCEVFADVYSEKLETASPQKIANDEMLTFEDIMYSRQPLQSSTDVSVQETSSKMTNTSTWFPLIMFSGVEQSSDLIAGAMRKALNETTRNGLKRYCPPELLNGDCQDDVNRKLIYSKCFRSFKYSDFWNACAQSDMEEILQKASKLGKWKFTKTLHATGFQINLLQKRGNPMFVVFRKLEHTFPVKPSGMHYIGIWESLARAAPEKLLALPAGEELLTLRNYARSKLADFVRSIHRDETQSFLNTSGIRGLKECLAHFFPFLAFNHRCKA